MDGGGFGYSLLGSVADFFTDTMHNYNQDPPPQKKGQKRPRKPRQYLNYFTLALERFTDIENYFLDHKCLPCHCWLCEEKYNVLKVFNRSVLNWDEWSNDCKRHALNVWEIVTQELINAMIRGDENLFFERIARTDYVKLAKVIRKISI